ncbi:MAG: hypothetical protein IJU76_14725, partial [Desulfovibrionaceae bacterium]|nr:hypothetical protein [Desulfovibrionaceae bacterium]
MLRVFFLLLFALWLSPVSASELSFEEADSILQDTYTLVGYMELSGEKDYGNPHNVIRAALFGAFDSVMQYELDLNRRTAEGEEPLDPNFPLFTVEGRVFTPTMTASREKAPALFADKPEQYTTFISREAVEIAALRFTGH